MDTIFDDQMRPVFNNEPEVVKRRLQAKYPENWEKVCVGETGQVVSVTEYLHGIKYTAVRKLLEDLLRRQSLPAFQRNPERLNIYLDSGARRIIELVLGE
jgi:hypothetical protein